jgi:predicted metal-binding membrane protein
VFVAAWQLMIVAMMLPSSLPLIRLFVAVAARQERSGRSTAALLSGYAAVWTIFGAAAFLLDTVVHRSVERLPWLEAHPEVIAGSVLLVAGAFQFTDLKDRCLRECRHPAPFLLSHYARGPRAAFRLGLAHGLFCLGCCWALMLVGFAAGVANLWWMAALTAVMVYEKTGRRGDEAVTPVGVSLLVAGALTMI